MELFRRNPFAEPFNSTSFGEWPAGSPTNSVSQTFMFSRRGSADSTISTKSEFVPGNSADQLPPTRLSTEQIMILERQFSDTPKPSTKTRRGLSEATGLSIQRVAAWFQSRRAKAKQQKKHEELQTRRILESAGRRRATVPSSPTINIVPSLFSHSQDDMNMIATPPRRTKSATAFFSIPSTPPGTQDQSVYKSPSEASYASLARSLAVAEAAASGLDSVQSPWPVSAFSDYGSSQCSYANTPYSNRHLEDPFEYDNHLFPNDASTLIDSYFSNQPPRDDFSAFAQALETNSMNYNFVLPAFPPKTLVEKRPQFGTRPHPEPAPKYQHSTACSRRPSFQLNVQSSNAIHDSDSSDGSLANRRQRPNPKPLGLRCHSYMGPSQSSLHDQRLCESTLRRINSIGGETSLIECSNPSRISIDAGNGSLQDIIESTITARPDITGSVSAGRCFSQLFSQGVAPPTPDTPDYSSSSAQSSNEQSLREQYTLSKICTKNQMSPPNTPQNLVIAETLAAKLEDEICLLEQPEDSEPGLLSSIPRHFEPSEETINFGALFGAETDGSSRSSRDCGDMFPFDYLTNGEITFASIFTS